MLAATVILATLSGQERPGLEGNWQGTLQAGGAQLRLVLRIQKGDAGVLKGNMESVDQGGVIIPIDLLTVTGDDVRLDVKAVNGNFTGKFNADRSELAGTWTQGAPRPLTFKRATQPVAAAKPAPAPMGVPVEVLAPIEPVPFTGGGELLMAYELHLTNFSRAALHLQRVEVLAAGSVLANFDAADLDGMIARPGTADVPDRREIGAGLRAVVFIWLKLDGAAPNALRHRLTFDNGTVEGGPLAVSGSPVVLGPPLRGDNWLAANGPGNSSIHRRAILPVDGRPRIAQRFAIDWVRLEENGKSTFHGDRADNRNYRAYGAEALAVADGVVMATKDGIPENVPGPASRAVPITLETVGGNHVILDLGGSRFAFYAHLQPGSLRVKTGDRVKRGQVLGLVGNSGNSTEPHLHFHVSATNSPLGSEGVPCAFDRFEVTQPAQEKRERQIPLQNEIVRFE